jgi:RNA polymerase sigma factor (sigma-70 family)
MSKDEYDRLKPRRLTDTQQKIIFENMNLVYSVAGKYKGRGLSWDDLVSVGKLGLISAALVFDPSREGAEFTRGTLFYNSIEGYIINEFNREAQRGFTIGKAFVKEDDDVLVDETSTLYARAKQVKKRINKGVSCEAQMAGRHGEESDTTYGDLITIKHLDERYEERCAVNKNLRSVIKKYITNANEIRVINYLFQGLEFSQIAKIWWRDNVLKTEAERNKGVTYQSIQRVYNRAVEKLRSVPEFEFML